MNLGTRPRHSLRMMLEIARLSDEERPTQLSEIASWTGISRRYLEQLVIPLKNASLLKGRTGRKGGYTLGRDPEEIRLREILEVSSGPVELARCVDQPNLCRLSPSCHCRLLWMLITHRIRDVLDEYSLSDLVDPEWLRDRLQEEARGREKRVARQAAGGKAHQAHGGKGRRSTRTARPSNASVRSDDNRPTGAQAARAWFADARPTVRLAKSKGPRANQTKDGHP